MNRKRYLAATLAAVTLGAASAAPGRAEDQPHMQHALEALKTARQDLEQARPDKGGHREEAIRWVDEAIHQIEDGIHYADKEGAEHREHEEGHEKGAAR